MIPLLRRASIVCLVGIIVFWLFQVALTRDDVVGTHLTLTATGTDGDGRPVAWTASVSETGRITRGGRPMTLSDLQDAVLGAAGRLTVQGVGAHLDAAWEATVADGEVTLDGEAADASALAARLAKTATPVKTTAVTVADVQAKAAAGELPCPTRSRVSFPEFPFGKAFPDDTYRACFPPELKYEPPGEPIEITAFHDPPMLARMDNPEHMPPEYRGFFPETLPPVDERLPVNPAVVVGPDGIGHYGGVWRRVNNNAGDVETKLGYESFIRFDPAGRIQPALAYRWEIEDDNRVYTFYLRKGHRWSDGHPFTAQDILWVCNTLIGSSYWPSSPNWMMETDGRALLYAEDVRDWPALAEAILSEAGADAPSMGGRLAAVDEDLIAMLKRIGREGAPDEPLQIKLVDALNAAFRNPDFFAAEAMDGDDRDSELRALMERGFSHLSETERDRVILLMNRNDLVRRASAIEAAEARGETTGDELAATERSQMNLLLFRLHYADWVDRARVKKVIVEAVDDGTGDDTHIIRFTFPRPNAIFLAKTGTFMFYRGLFTLARHFTAQYHPAGTRRLVTTDILDWQGLFDLVRRQAAAGDPSVGKRLWDRLDDETRALVDEAEESLETLSADRKARIVEALNAAFETDDFFDAAAWANVPWDADRREIAEEGISASRRDRAKMTLFRQRLRRADLMARVAGEGLDSLSDEERFDFHVSMFRAAYDERAQGKPLVATNREEGLNVAAQHHPRQYTSWVNLMRGLRNYHPVENPGRPTLRPWRAVSEAIDTTQIAVRNPYYYRVDAAGNQLPYIDVIETKIEAEKSNRMLAMASGGVDFQVRGLTFDTFTFLKAHEDQGDYEVLLWANDYCGEMNFYPLQNHKNEALAEVFQDPRFRHALSAGLNRREIIDVVFGGLGEPGQCAPPEGSPYYHERLATISVEHDPRRANALLDEMGLTERNADGIRVLTDGTPLILNLDVDEEAPLAAIQLACAHWREIDLDVRMKVRSRQLINRMIDIGILDIGVRKEGGNYRAPMQAGAFAPTHPAECGHWASWVTYLRTGGRNGTEPPDYLREIDRLWENVVSAPSEEAKMAAWDALAERTADDLPAIGLMTSPGKVVYVRRGFMNVPRLSMAGWIAHEPGNTCPESYFFAREER
ncbi:MAG: ABC transporter substrate-binding protein [Planctomycetota bacterium]